MNRIWLLLVAGVCVSACLSKPEPWAPAGDLPSTSDTGDIVAGEIDVAEGDEDGGRWADAVEPAPDVPVIELDAEDTGADLDEVVDVLEMIETKADLCQPDCVDGACVCVPICADKDCGDDGCGGSCGECVCNPDCAGAKCGDDGCGGSCGECDDGDPCTVGDVCADGNPPVCAGLEDQPACDWDHDLVEDGDDGCPYTFDAGGQLGALQFNGISQRVDLAGPDGIGGAPVQMLTLSLWINITLNLQNRMIWFDQSSTSSSRLVSVGDNTVRFELDTGIGTIMASCGSMAEDQWQHIAAVWDGSHATCYLNGEAMPSVPATGMISGEVGTRLAAGDAQGSGFKGMIDDVVFSSRAWAAEEIKAHYLSSLPFATRLTPGAQSDFDDIRVTELPVEDNVEFYARSVVRGVRPTSDSDTPGLVAHWRFDGDTIDQTNGFTASLDAGAELVTGRFGEPSGALRFGPGADQAVVGNPPELDFTSGHLYLDGLLDGEDPIPGGFGSVKHPDPLRFGVDAAAFLLELDEVRIHGAIRSADYFYTNIQPSLPVVRLLASTSRGEVDGAYPYHGYTLRWGDPDAQAFVPSVPDPEGGDACAGLLNECSGYVGWWRFDEGRGTAAMDSSSNGNHGLYMDMAEPDSAATMEPDFVAGLDGGAVAFSGDGTHVTIPSSDSRSYQLALYGNEGVGIGNNNIGGGSSDAWFTSPADTFWPTGEWQVLRGAFSEHGATLSLGDLSWNYPPEPPVQCSYEGSPLTLGAFQGCCAPPSVGDFVHGSVDSVRIMNRRLYPDEYLNLPLPEWSFGEFAQDADGDGVPEEASLPACGGGQTIGCADNCPDVWNPDQADWNTIGEGGNACRDQLWPGDWPHCLQIDITGDYPVDFAHKIPLDVATAPPGLLASGGVDFKVVPGWCGACYRAGSEPVVFPQWLDNYAGAETANLWSNTGQQVVDSVAVYYGKPGAVESFDKMDIFHSSIPALQLAYGGEVEANGHFTDASGYGRHGIPGGGAAADPDGKFGSCIKTNGGWVVSPNVVLSAGIPASFSVVAWVKAPASGTRTIAGEWGATFGKGRFYLAVVDGKIRFVRLEQAPNANYAQTSDEVVPNDQWFHVAAVYDNVGKKLMIYVNGVKRSVQSG